MLYALYGLAAALFLVTCSMGYLVYSLSGRIKKLTTGTNGKSLESAIYRLMDDHIIHQHRMESLEKTTGRLNTEIRSTPRGVATVRYNAFNDVGGKQSFATAILSEEGTGVVISSMYSRDRVNVYAKPIVNGASEYELSKEEVQALKEASKIFN